MDLSQRARLFKSGALCSITDYKFNISPASRQTARTTGPACGEGFYNSHGFVRYWNSAGTDYAEFLTFPTDPLEYPAPSPSAITTNEAGQTIGSGEGAQSENDLPDLVSAIGENGTNGYVKKADLLAGVPSSPEQASAKRTAGSRSVPLYAANGVTQLDTFTIG